MVGNEFNELVNDIQKNGQQEPIWLYEGKIIDGRNRYRACQELNIEPITKDWVGNGSLVSFVISLNLHRRHLTSSQKAAIATEIEPILAKEAKKRQGKRTDLKPNISQKIEQSQEVKLNQGNNINKNKATEQAAKLIQTNRQYVSDAKKIKEKAPEVFKEVKSGNINIPDAKRIINLPEEKQKEVVEKVVTGKAKNIREATRQVKNENLKPIELPKEKYNIILSDPPWKYDFAETESRAIENQYPTMTLEAIQDLEIPGAKDSVLFLWATAPKLLEALSVMKSWGYQYKTHAAWDKGKIGMGYWFRGQHELLLVGTKGAFSPPMPENRFSSIIHSDREKHSKKPEIVYEMLEKMFPYGKFLEIFARGEREGWKTWGNQIQ
jgi:N6-adenosine-specific RNA methylase IME4